MTSRAHWDQPRQAPRGRRPSAQGIGGAVAAICADRVLRVLSSSKFRKGSLEQMDYAGYRASLLAPLLRCTRAGVPVQLTLMAFPFKVPNPAKVGPRFLPDLAELTAIRRCLALAAAIAEVYPPGLQLDLIHDGGLICDVFGVGVPEVRAYEAYFARLLHSAGAGEVIRCHDFDALQRSAGLDATVALEGLQEEARQWWRVSRGTRAWRAAFHKTLGMLWLRDVAAQEGAEILEAGRLGYLPAQYTALERRVHEAMVAYRVKNAIIHLFDPRSLSFPDAIHTTTHVRTGRLGIWLVRRGSSLLPWHGVAIVDEAGRARVAAYHEICAREDLSGVCLPGEDTPFCYAPSNGHVDLSAVLPA